MSYLITLKVRLKLTSWSRSPRAEIWSLCYHAVPAAVLSGIIGVHSNIYLLVMYPNVGCYHAVSAAVLSGRVADLLHYQSWFQGSYSQTLLVSNVGYIADILKPMIIGFKRISLHC